MKEETKELVATIMRNGINSIFENAAQYIGQIESILEVTKGAQAKNVFSATFENISKSSSKLKELVINIKAEVDEMIEAGLIVTDQKERIVKNCDDCIESIDEMNGKIAALLAEPEAQKAEDADVAGETEKKEGE